jgi:hypothetical protein
VSHISGTLALEGPTTARTSFVLLTLSCELAAGIDDANLSIEHATLLTSSARASVVLASHVGRSGVRVASTSCSSVARDCASHVPQQCSSALAAHSNEESAAAHASSTLARAAGVGAVAIMRACNAASSGDAAGLRKSLPTRDAHMGSCETECNPSTREAITLRV